MNMSELRTSAYAVGHGREEFDVVVRELGPVVDGGTLVPRAESESEWSLSGAYGLGQFPWHTDGAISSAPPRWMLLYGERVVSLATTDLLVPSEHLLQRLAGSVLRSKDRSGRVRYLPAVVPLDDGRSRLRWDPRACPAVDDAVTAFVAAQAPTVSIQWRQDMFVVVDNFRVMHRRSPADGLERRLSRSYVFEEN